MLGVGASDEEHMGGELRSGRAPRNLRRSCAACASGRQGRLAAISD